MVLVESRLAGIKASQQFGRTSDHEVRHRCRSIFVKVRDLQRFESVWNNILALRGGVLAQISNEVTIRRCEQVTAGEIQKAIIKVMTSINDTQALTGAGRNGAAPRTNM